MTRTVVILLSDKRSGSTLLERELCKHSCVNHVSYTPHTYHETHFWLKAACLLSESGQQFYSGVRPTCYGSRFEVRKSLLNFLQHNIPGIKTPACDSTLVFDGWTALCEKFAQPVFFEKSPQTAHHWAALELLLSWLRRTDYQVRIIGLVRNPMSVMYSALQLFQTNPETRQFSWAQAYSNILRIGEFLDDEQFHFVRYEDIVDQPASEFQKLCDFIGIDYEPAIGQSVHGGSVNKWRDDLGFSLQLDESVSGLAVKMGYTEQDLYNPPKPEPAYLDRVRSDLLFGLKRRKQKTYNFIKRLMIQTGISD